MRGNMSKNWSKPFHGITHYGNLRDPRRASVSTNSKFSVLTLHYKDIKGNHQHMEFHVDSCEEAKRIGKAWVDDFPNSETRNIWFDESAPISEKALAALRKSHDESSQL